MRKVFIFSPLMLAILVAIEVFFILGRDHGTSSDFGEAALVLGGLAIFFGYGIIGIVAGLYKLLRMGNFIEKEDETTSTQLEAF